MIREQALAMVAGAPVDPIVEEDAAVADREWKARLADATKHGIHWDANLEQFVSTTSR